MKPVDTRCQRVFFFAGCRAVPSRNSSRRVCEQIHTPCGTRLQAPNSSIPLWIHAGVARREVRRKGGLPRRGRFALHTHGAGPSLLSFLQSLHSGVGGSLVDSSSKTAGSSSPPPSSWSLDSSRTLFGVFWGAKKGKKADPKKLRTQKAPLPKNCTPRKLHLQKLHPKKLTSPAPKHWQRAARGPTGDRL
jgi:hypothetical protein